MVVTITSRSSKAEIEKALKKLEGQRTKRRRQSKKVFDARNYCGVIKLKQDPSSIAKTMEK